MTETEILQKIVDDPASTAVERSAALTRLRGIDCPSPLDQPTQDALLEAWYACKKHLDAVDLQARFDAETSIVRDYLSELCCFGAPFNGEWRDAFTKVSALFLRTGSQVVRARAKGAIDTIASERCCPLVEMRNQAEQFLAEHA